MKTSVHLAIILSVLGFVVMPGNVRPAAAEETNAQAKIKVVILTGGHGFDRPAFDKFWSGLEGLETEVWKGTTPYSIFDSADTFKHDVIVMYNLTSGMTAVQKENFLKLLGKGIGLVVWHHALANCQDWPEFEKIAGAKFWLKPGQREGGAQVAKSGVAFGKAKMHIEDPAHRITAGLTDFELDDEFYNHQTFAEGIKVLVTTGEPRSDKVIAWTHTYGKSRIFGYQSGHGVKVWTNDNFGRILAGGIRWVSNREAEASR